MSLLRLPPFKPWMHGALALATLGSTFITFQLTFGGAGHGVQGSALFAVALLCILGAHEMGHYVLARRHGVDSTLPYFLPVPLLGFGTLGAVIRVRSPIPHRNALLDIGAAGPLAGVAVAVPVLLVGLLLSPVVQSGVPAESFPAEGSVLGLLQQARESWQGRPPEVPRAGHLAWLFSDSPLLLGLRFLVKGPLPEGTDVQSHPLVIAGWFGLLVTLLNLVPVGQLDGGHVAYAWLGQRAVWVGRAALLGLGYFALFHALSWAVWLGVAAWVVKTRHPPVVDESVQLSAGRKWIAAGCFVLFFLCLMPAPLRLVSVP